MTWDLSVFYTGFDDPALRADMEAIKTAVSGAEAMLAVEESAKDKLEKFIDLEETVTKLLGSAFAYAQLTLEADNANEEALRVVDELSQLMVDVKLMNSRLTRYVGSVDNLEDVIASSEKLSANAFILREDAKAAAHMLPAEMEKWLLKMSLNGGDAFSKLRDRLMGGHMVDYRGESLPLPAVRGLAYDADASVRKDAYEAELASYAKVETSMAYCLGAIKGEAHTMCELKDYPDPLTQTLDESRMDHETLDATRTATREPPPRTRPAEHRDPQQRCHGFPPGRAGF